MRLILYMCGYLGAYRATATVEFTQKIYGITYRYLINATGNSIFSNF